MKYLLLSLVMALSLTACARELQQPPAQISPSSSPAQSRPIDRETSAELDVGGETVPASLYVGEGYSIYIPSDGWTLELDSDDGILHQTWEADREDDACLSVYHYKDMSFAVARDRFLRDSGYTFSPGPTGEPGDPLTGSDEDGDLCALAVAEGSHGTTYVIAREYPKGTEETWGVVLEALADTFALAE